MRRLSSSLVIPLRGNLWQRQFNATMVAMSLAKRRSIPCPLYRLHSIILMHFVHELGKIGTKGFSAVSSSRHNIVQNIKYEWCGQSLVFQSTPNGGISISIVWHSGFQIVVREVERLCLKIVNTYTRMEKVDNSNTLPRRRIYWFLLWKEWLDKSYHWPLAYADSKPLAGGLQRMYARAYFPPKGRTINSDAWLRSLRTLVPETFNNVLESFLLRNAAKKRFNNLKCLLAIYEVLLKTAQSAWRFSFLGIPHRRGTVARVFFLWCNFPPRHLHFAASELKEPTQSVRFSIEESRSLSLTVSYCIWSCRVHTKC